MDPLRGALEGVGLGNRYFFGPWNGYERSLKKSRFSGPTPSSAPSNGYASLKTIKYKLHIKYSYVPPSPCS